MGGSSREPWSLEETVETGDRGSVSSEQVLSASEATFALDVVVVVMVVLVVGAAKESAEVEEVGPGIPWTLFQLATQASSMTGPSIFSVGGGGSRMFESSF